jgi:hypothetical protein
MIEMLFREGGSVAEAQPSIRNVSSVQKVTSSVGLFLLGNRKLATPKVFYAFQLSIQKKTTEVTF